ncbi:MAG: PAS domain S-box protein [Candidatus Hydrogenedentes bacterium]|nr:PAS domain S-box protein [Candidatus Hydrogenedentota bacterium]
MKKRKLIALWNGLFSRPFSIFFTVALLSVLFWWITELGVRDRVRQSTRITTEETAARIQLWLDDRTGILAHLASEGAATYAADPALFQSTAEGMAKRIAGFQAINWVDTEGIIRAVTPLAGNERALGANLLNHPSTNVRDALSRARSTGKPARTLGTIELLQGGQGFASYWPAFNAQGVLTGFVNGVFRIETMARQCLQSPAMRANFHYCIEESNGELVFNNDLAPPLLVNGFDLELSMTVVDVPWMLHVTPTQLYFDRGFGARREWILAAGAVLAFMLGTAQFRISRHEAQERQGRRRYRALFEQAPVAQFATDRSGIIREANAAAALLTGYAAGELLGTPMIDLYVDAPTGRGKAEQIFDRLKSGRTDRIDGEELELLTKRRSLRLVRLTTQPVLDAQGQFSEARSVLFDITDSRAAEEERTRLATAVEQAADAIVITDINGVIQYCNPRFEVLTGHAGESLIGRHVRTDALPEEAVNSLFQTLRDGGNWESEYHGTAKDGSAYVSHVTVTPVYNQERKLTNFAIVQRDISHQIELENQLRQAQKMEAMGTLAGGIAHDFNNILHALIGYANLAGQLALPEQTELAHALEEIQKGGNRAAELVRQILTFSRKSEIEQKPLRAQPLVREALKLIRGAVPSSIAIEAQIDENCGMIRTDATQMHQTIMNLCSNAAQAIRNGTGIIRVILAELTPDATLRSAVPGLGRQAYVCLCVQDNGEGITPEVRERMFDPYFTTKEPGKGTGLGLATVHGIVKSHGGAIHVESAPGEGTAIYIYFPRCENEAEEPEPQKDALISNRPGRVMFVDDEKQIVQLSSLVLENLGYLVEAYSDSQAALDAFRLDPDRFDIVISDLTMPHLTGDALAKEIRAIHPTIPILICSGFTDIGALAPGVEDIVSEILQKPIRFETLCNAINRHWGAQ